MVEAPSQHSTYGSFRSGGQPASQPFDEVPDGGTGRRNIEAKLFINASEWVIENNIGHQVAFRMHIYANLVPGTFISNCTSFALIQAPSRVAFPIDASVLS